MDLELILLFLKWQVGYLAPFTFMQTNTFHFTSLGTSKISQSCSLKLPLQNNFLSWVNYKTQRHTGTVPGVCVCLLRFEWFKIKHILFFCLLIEHLLHSSHHLLWEKCNFISVQWFYSRKASRVTAEEWKPQEDETWNLSFVKSESKPKMSWAERNMLVFVYVSTV